MAFLERLFVSGDIADLIVIILVAEAAGLLTYWIMSKRGVPPVDVLIYLASGASLLIALRIALTGGPWQGIAVALSVSFITHLVDLGRRWR